MTAVPAAPDAVPGARPRLDKNRLVGLAMAGGWQLVQALPAPVADAAFSAGGEWLFRRQGRPVIQLARNLHRVLGERSTPATLARVTRAGMHSYARYWKETLRLPVMNLDRVYRRARDNTYGLDRVQQALDAGRGVVLAVPHSGNWDVAGLVVTGTFGAMTTVAERLEPASLFDKFVDYRTSLGMTVLPLTGGQGSVSGLLRAELDRGKIVCLPADRDLTANGVPVTFFGEQTKMPAGPAMLAALTGAMLCTVRLHFTDDGGWRHDVQPEIPITGERLRDKVAAATQRIADEFAAGIAARPQDWHMMQPLWLSDLSARRSGAR